jgi:uroporphyrinogen decarboxylase
MIEGQSSSDFATVKKMLYQRPDLLHQILAVNAAAVTAYLNAQIEAGVQAVMIFDTWGGMLSHAAFHEFSLAYTARVFGGLVRVHEHVRVPCIVFTKGGSAWLEDIAAIGCEAIGLDWTVDIGLARERVGARVALQGNLDPAVLLASPEIVQREARRVLESYGRGDGHVFNLGHGISQFTPPDNVSALIETVRGLSGSYH